MSNQNEETRQCRICGGIKPLDQFEKDSRKPGGITNRCQPCKSSYYDSLRGKAYKAYHHAKERADKFGVKNDLTFEQVYRLFEVFDGNCAYCGREALEGEVFELEHIFPMNKGGTNSLDNVLVSCQSCNRKKYDKPLVLFYQESDEFTEGNMAGIILYISLMKGIDKEQVLKELVDSHSRYFLETLYKQLEREMKVAANE